LNLNEQFVAARLASENFHVQRNGWPDFFCEREDGRSNSLGGSHCSPREHLRRGHIRRIAGNRCVWVNSCVVAAGSRFGVSKDYTMRNPAYG
jgi:hypothetical protein